MSIPRLGDLPPRPRPGLRQHDAPGLPARASSCHFRARKRLARTSDGGSAVAGVGVQHEPALADDSAPDRAVLAGRGRAGHPEVLVRTGGDVTAGADALPRIGLRGRGERRYAGECECCCTHQRGDAEPGCSSKVPRDVVGKLYRRGMWVIEMWHGFVLAFGVAFALAALAALSCVAMAGIDGQDDEDAPYPAAV